MNNSQYRCMNQVSASGVQRQHRLLNSSLEDTDVSPLVQQGSQLLNGSTSVASIERRVSSAVVHFCHLRPVVQHICHFALDSPI
ncbi:hypothetical protein TNCV_3470671 [Trichonephila clavipes]|nr:hypothetical protein TNCV_3470671 [Trichonephila clavipes]